jgi:hypothetical protein
MFPLVTLQNNRGGEKQGCRIPCGNALIEELYRQVVWFVAIGSSRQHKAGRTMRRDKFRENRVEAVPFLED